ncbi:MAG: homoserine dehydrogenase [Leptospirales bacterium]
MVKIGLFGLGTVGKSLVEIIQKGNYPIEIVGIVDRSFHKKKDIIGDIPASDQPEDLLNNESIDIIVETMGGIDHALYVVREALDKKKNVITANKFLLAEHGYALFNKANQNGVKIGFEAAVAGALPIIRNLENIFFYEDIPFLEGILNGTTNYILSRMRKEKLDYTIVLEDAKKLGFAEADPTLDINGMDAVHKLALLGSLLSGTWMEYHNIDVRGIENIRLADISVAERMGYRIRQISRYQKVNDKVFLSVEPSLIGPSHFLWDIDMENNAIMFQGNYSGDHLFVGKGAGGFPTAYSVLSDIMHFTQGNHNPLQSESFSWVYGHISPQDEKTNAFYMRMLVKDKTGMLTLITGLLSKSGISIASVHQEAPYEKVEGDDVDLIIVTHRCLRKDFQVAIKEINKLEGIKAEIVVLPIDDSL